MLALTATGVTSAGAVSRTKAKKPPAKHKVAVTHGLTAPGLLSPSNGIDVQQVPPLVWSAVSGAEEYEYQLSADPQFHSPVLGSGPGLGTAITHNLAAALSKPVPDGTYYWRVRGLTKLGQPGPWSPTRSLTKAWSATPVLLSPASSASITWPAVPLVLEWTPVPGATEYIVTIATDPALSNVVLGTTNSPQKTVGTVFALPGTLAANTTYYWAVTPVDVEGHRGARSSVRSFTWSWPSQTQPFLVPLNTHPGETALEWTPEFTWNPIPGAARYELEVNGAEGFPPGSTWYRGTTIGTSASPLHALNNQEYYWRVRAIDSNGNAGVWNEGPRFSKAFDTPHLENGTTNNVTLENLRVTDEYGETLPDPVPGGGPVQSDGPIVQWSPVPGAASYEVLVTTASSGCTKVELTEFTAVPAWTPLRQSPHFGQSGWPGPQPETIELKSGEGYCIVVAALSDIDQNGHQIESTTTPVASGHIAFTYRTRYSRCGEALFYEEHGNLSLAESIYETPEYLSREQCEAEVEVELPTAGPELLSPQSGTLNTTTPLFTWTPVPFATSYWVVIARDPSFTNVVDVARTWGTGYAPPAHGEEPLDDQTTTYYWEVIPETGCGEEACGYHEFNKHSIPPTPLAPANGANISAQPTFKWTPAEGALNYTVEVSENPSFSEPIDDVKTDSTSYTSASTYPADVTLYWRVRANDIDKVDEHEGLDWSTVQTFERTLPTPVPTSGAITEGQGVPIRTWTPVTGATAYEVLVELSNGSTRNFTVDSTAFTPTERFGNGFWHWQVRAAFPLSGAGTVPGAFFAPQAFDSALAPPTVVRAEKSGARILLSWNPDPYATEYEVQLSKVESFNTTVETRRVDENSWAPNIDLTGKEAGGTLYWRVAAIDPGDTVGTYATGSFAPPKPAATKPKCVIKKVKKGRKTVKKCVPVAHAPARAKKNKKRG